MKVLILNTYDTGGAANACIRLHEGLLNADVDSKLLVLHKKKDVKHSYQFDSKRLQKKSILNKINLYFRKFLKKLGFKIKKSSSTHSFISQRNKELDLFSFPQTKFDITKSDLYKEADIINLHWTANFLDYQSFFKKNKKPVVWTLHDMNPFTGGEHYIEKFIGISNSGEPIPRVLTEYEKTTFKNVENHKLKALKHFKDLTISAPSQWLLEESKKSKVFGNYKSVCIPYGLDSKKFRFCSKIEARNHFNLPLDKKIILFVADSLTNSRKGFAYLLKSIVNSQNEFSDTILCAVGKKNADLNHIPNLVQIGYLSDYDSLSYCYSAADVFVIPSIMDNLPNTVLESLMCGTPVIGFPSGGIVDMIEHGVNGLIVKDKTVDSLRTTLVDFINGGYNFNPQVIRDRTIVKYNLAKQANKYLELFNNILNNENLDCND
ncbi:glycosyltransferase [Nonlabens ulvanivorans]|uniref:glycosyltransferase n=1 Tax=Nonlabens ulvanivorans TaxID=906888 RepID=UPI0037C99526